MVMRSSIARCIFRRTGPTIRIVWKLHTCLRCRLCDQTKTCDENDRTRDSASVHSSGLPAIPSTVLATSNSKLRRAGKGYCLGSQRSCVSILGKRPSVAGTAADIARTRAIIDWSACPARAGTKGPRLHVLCYLDWPTSRPKPFNSANDGLWTRGLLIRRHIADGDLAFFTTWCPAGTSIETLVAVEGHRWAIEESFETAEKRVRLDHNESRSWHGWHRHVFPGDARFAMMAAIRHRANPPPPKKTKRRTPAKTKAQPRRH